MYLYVPRLDVTRIHHAAMDTARGCNIRQVQLAERDSNESNSQSIITFV